MVKTLVAAAALAALVVVPAGFASAADEIRPHPEASSRLRAAETRERPRQPSASPR